GTAFRYTFPENTFNDADGDALTYTAAQGDGSPLPGWLSFDGRTRTFSGTPQAGNEGILSVKVTVSDGNGGSISDSFEITIGEAVLGTQEAEDFSIYPNPASGHFTLTGVSKSLSGVSLVSMAGRKIRHYPASEDGRYDISDLSEGIFLVIVETNSGRKHTGRVVIKR
ncbi:MAG: putative Ig domain-containing protein, partial [Ekhidna sp.]|nr:putative Ig domain-containing protein [Ekhidna sp.]